MRRIVLLFSTIIVTILVAYMVPASAQSTAPQLLKEFTVDGSSNVKFPGVAAVGSAVFLSGGVNSSDAVVWTMTEQATNSGLREVVGAARGQADYSSVSVTTATDGSTYAIWSSIDEKRIYMRQRSSAGAWGAVRTVTSGGFPIFPQIAVTSNGQIFAIWIDLGVPLRLAVSSDGGVSWSGPYLTSVGTYSAMPAINVGANNEVVIGFTTVDLDPAVAIWTGASLTTEVIPVSVDMADASAAVGLNGKIYAVWRGIDDSGANSGIFYGERLGTNSWSSRQLVAGSVKGAVNIKIDTSGTQHLGWITNISGGQRFHYTFRQSGQSAFMTPAHTSVDGVFNSRLAFSSDGAYAHAVMEDFTGNLHTAYARFSGGAPKPSATPEIAGGDAMIAGQSSVLVNFLNPQGSPTQVRWRWNSEPTDASTDSNGWQTFASTMTITVPGNVLTAATCTPTVLYTQLRNANQAVSTVQSDSVIFDTGVTASTTLSNPYMLSRSSSFSDLDATPNDSSSDTGASDGHPAYTRHPLIYVAVQGVAECSGISTLAIGRSETSFAPALTVVDGTFANVLGIPGSVPLGSNQVWLRVVDKIGNSKTYSTTMIYDPTPPVLDSTSPGTFTATSNAEATILASLKFGNINVTDAYPGRGFWGVWVANSREQVADPATNTNLIWYPIAAPGTSTTFTIDNWSLASGLKNAQITTGDYFIYVRFLDGAGNPTASVMPAAKVTLTTVTFSKIFLPLSKR